MARVRILKKPTRRNLILEADLWERLIDRARAEDRSLSSVTRRALSDYLGKRRRREG